MGFAFFFPQSEKAVKKYGSKYGTASKYMIYNGPFVQKGWTESNLSWKMVKNKYLANTNIRKAISLAVKRKGLVSLLGGNNLAANTLTPPGLTDVNGKDYTNLLSSSAESLYPSSTKKSEAVKYLNKGLKQLGVSKFSFKILADDTELRQEDSGTAAVQHRSHLQQQGQRHRPEPAVQDPSFPVNFRQL